MFKMLPEIERDDVISEAVFARLNTFQRAILFMVLHYGLLRTRIDHFRRAVSFLFMGGALPRNYELYEWAWLYVDLPPQQREKLLLVAGALKREAEQKKNAEKRVD